MELLTTGQAAEILGFSSLRYTRDALKTPDKIEKSSVGIRYLYTLEHVEKVKTDIACQRCIKAARKGKISCYQCRKDCEKCELRSGLCADCQARKLVLNFSCHGDCTKCQPDCAMIKCLEKALANMKNQIHQQPDNRK